MKKLLLASCALASIASWSAAAKAGDLGLAPASYDWSGGYVGVGAGAGLNNSTLSSNYRYTGPDSIGQANLDLINGLDHTDDLSGAAFTAGVLAGYNVQMSNIVLGVEGDFNYIGFNDQTRHDVSGVMNNVLSPVGNAVEKIDFDANWFGTVRGRLGYAIDNVLVYGTGGLAYGKLNVRQKLNASNDSQAISWESDDSAWKMGWTLGGGIEYGLDNWTLGLEYLYVDLNSYGWDAKANATLANSTAQNNWSRVKEEGEADYKFSVARATVKYRF